MIIKSDEEILLIKRLIELDKKDLRSLFKEKFLREPKSYSTREEIINCLFLFIQANVSNLKSYKLSELKEMQTIFQKVPENTCVTDLESRINIILSRKHELVKKTISEEKPIDKRSWQEKREERKNEISQEIKKANPIIWGRVGSAERYIMLKLAGPEGITLQEIALGLCEDFSKYREDFGKAIARVRYTWYSLKKANKGIIFEFDELGQKKKRIRFKDFDMTDKGKEMREKYERSLILLGKSSED